MCAFACAAGAGSGGAQDERGERTQGRSRGGSGGSSSGTNLPSPSPSSLYPPPTSPSTHLLPLPTSPSTHLPPPVSRLHILLLTHHLVPSEPSPTSVTNGTYRASLHSLPITSLDVHRRGGGGESLVWASSWKAKLVGNRACCSTEGHDAMGVRGGAGGVPGGCCSGGGGGGRGR